MNWVNERKVHHPPPPLLSDHGFASADFQVKILVAVRIQTEVLKQKLIQDLNDAWKETVSWTCLETPPTKADKPSRDDVASSARCEEDARQWELKLPKSDSASEQQSLKEVRSSCSGCRLTGGAKN